MMDIGLLLPRVAVGLTVAAHGAQKVFGWFGGPGRDGFAGFLESLGFRRTRFYTWLAGGAEMLGGVLLALGLLTPLAVAAIIGVMLTASVAAHARNGFFADRGGYELPFVIAVAAAAVSLAGPGTFALDAVLGQAWTGLGWGLGAIVLGILASGAVLTARRLEARELDASRVRTA
jgi:putative oxidoreductase